MTKLFSEFSPVSKYEWEEIIDLDAKKAFTSRENLTLFEDGINTEPIYHADDNSKVYISKFPRYWETYQLIDATNAKQANKRALDALKNDASGLCFINPNKLDILLKNIYTEHIRIDFARYHKDFPKEWKEYTKGKNVCGAFHGKTNYSIPNYFDTIFTEGTAQQQLSIALKNGLNSKKPVQFHFKISENYFLEIA